MRDDLVVYVSDQAHSSLARAARTLGFRPDQVQRAADRRRSTACAPTCWPARSPPTPPPAGAPLFVVRQRRLDQHRRRRPAGRAGRDLRGGTARGCTSTRAYGGFAALTERGRGWLRGIELADSVTLDPHKWLYQPFECGCLLVREGERLRRAFTITPDYLADAEAEDEEVNFSDLGLQLTRSRAGAEGVDVGRRCSAPDAFRAAIDASLDLAQLAEARVREHPELELLSPAQLGIVCFRRRFAGGEDAQDAHNAALVRAFAASGRGLVSSTRLHGAYAIRLCVLNHTSTAADVEATLEWLATADAPPAPLGTARGIGRPGARQATMAEAESGVGVEPRALATVPLFAGLDALRLQVLAAGARAEARTRGEAVVRRFESGRDFYVILAGRAEVHVGDRVVRDARAGRLLRRARGARLGRRLRLPAARHRGGRERPAPGQAERRRAARADARRPGDRRRDPPRRERAARDLVDHPRLEPCRVVESGREHLLSAPRAAAIAVAALARGCGRGRDRARQRPPGRKVVWAVFGPAVGWSFVGTGLYAWRARPESRIGAAHGPARLRVVPVHARRRQRGRRSTRSRSSPAACGAACSCTSGLSFPTGRLATAARPRARDRRLRDLPARVRARAAVRRPGRARLRRTARTTCC